MKHTGTLNDLLDYLIKKRVSITDITRTGDAKTTGEQLNIYLEDALIIWNFTSAEKTLRFEGKKKALFEAKLGTYFDPEKGKLKKIWLRYWEPIVGIGLGVIGLGVGIGSIIVSIALAK
jgi:hypothetical protein